MSFKLPHPPIKAQPGDFVWLSWYTNVQNILTSLNTTIELVGDPTTTELLPSFWGIYKNTTSGAVKLWANDGGTLKSVTLT